MLEELLKVVTEKTGLPADKAQGAIEAVLGFLKDKLPGPIAGQLDSFLGGGDDEAGGEDDGGGITDKIGDMAKGLFGND